MKISSVEPRQIPIAGGMIVHVSGSGFEPGLRVDVGGVAARQVETEGSSTVRFVAPAGRVGYADLELIGTVKVTQKNALLYVVLAPPVIRSITPKRGPTSGMIDVRIEGDNFVAGSQVLIHGKRPRSIILIDSTTLEVMPPPGMDGELVDVTVRNPDGAESTVKRVFQYDARFGSAS